MGLRGRSKRPGAGSQYELWAIVFGLCVGISSVVSGCARGVETSQGDDTEGDDSGASGSTNAGSSAGGSGGTSSSGGNTGASGSANAGSGGKIMNTSGGTNTTGGSAGGGAGSSAGSGGKAGSSGSGGASGTMNRGGASGSAGSGGKTTGGSAGTAGSGGGNQLACLQNWKGDKCDTCSTQTQSDKLGCVDILDCYETNACGPGTCDGNTQKCGANVIGKGTAGYPIAADVYNCLCK